MLENRTLAKCAITLRDLSWKGIDLFDNIVEDSEEASTNNNDDKLECSENKIETIEQSFKQNECSLGNGSKRLTAVRGKSSDTR